MRKRLHHREGVALLGRETLGDAGRAGAFGGELQRRGGTVHRKRALRAGRECRKREAPHMSEDVEHARALREARREGMVRALVVEEPRLLPAHQVGHVGRPPAFLTTQVTPVTATSAATSASSRASAQAAFGWTTAASPKRSITTPGSPSASAWTSR